MNRKELNQVYKTLDTKAHELLAPILSFRKDFPCTWGYFNGHYHKNVEGNYVMDYFPIPVISVEGLCDIELDLDRISVSAKLRRDMALEYDYEKLNAYKFEAFGVENYLEDYYVEGNTYAELLENIKASAEEEIGFAFEFSFEMSAQEMFEFVKFLKGEGFYY